MLEPERYNRAVRTLLRLLVGILVVIVVIAVPLLVVRPEDCRQGDRFEDVWSVAVPFQAERRRGCREPETGAEQLLGGRGRRVTAERRRYSMRRERTSTQ